MNMFNIHYMTRR